MKRFLIIVACVLISLTSISVMAQDSQSQPAPRRRGAPNGEKRIRRLDINNDGRISRDEWKGNPAAFDRIDKDGDGSLTREELREAARRQAGRLDQMDANKDGQISRDEWKGNEERFKRLDANGDGALTKEEIRGAHRNRH